MKLAIVHHHLNRGGVTQVIKDHVTALDRQATERTPEQVAILHGGRCDGWPIDLAGSLRNVELVVRSVEGLDYDDGTGAPDAQRLAESIAASLTALAFAADDTLVHVHNHALGKNVSLPGALRILARRGYRLLLQVHDFAEDFRPRDYRRLRSALGVEDADELGETLYPQAHHIHYAVLNHRDRSILRAAGVPDDRLHVLPNAVADRSCTMDRTAARRLLEARCGVPTDGHYLLYPARGIRRKNLGEALLWGAVFGPTVHVGLTLPATEDRDRLGYERWRALATQLRLSCTFETGAEHGVSIEQNLSASDNVLTTSVAEGFGLAFLEGTLAGRGLLGRDLPEVTKDFVNHGVTFGALGARVDVPESWIGRRGLVEMLRLRYNSTLACYGRPELSVSELETGLDAKLQRSAVDFGDLDAPAQEHVLRLVVGDRRQRAALLDINPWMGDALTGDGNDHATISANADAIRTNFSHSAAGARLCDIYAQLLHAPRQDSVDGLSTGGTVLREFLRLDRFRAVLA